MSTSLTETILLDIFISVIRERIASFLAGELRSFTIPLIILCSAVTYAILTRDPMRASLPPWMGFEGVWGVLWGSRNIRLNYEMVRLSFFGRDVFWVTEEVVNGLLVEGELVQIFHRNGVFMEYGEKERIVVDKVFCRWMTLTRF
jgi:hypothetical protein